MADGLGIFVGRIVGHYQPKGTQSVSHGLLGPACRIDLFTIY